MTRYVVVYHAWNDEYLVREVRTEQSHGAVACFPTRADAEAHIEKIKAA